MNNIYYIIVRIDATKTKCNHGALVLVVGPDYKDTKHFSLYMNIILGYVGQR